MSRTVAAPVKVAVAYSGGRDSTALLHATAKVAREQGYEVVALHVHHGLQPRADEWLAHCEDTCRRWRKRGWPLAFDHVRLALTVPAGASVEACARQARYAALRDMALAHGVEAVLLGHHRTDQAETFLLQALRGAGMAGLAAMPAAIQRDGLWWLRPWLARSRADIDAYVRRHRLRHVDDDSNDDPRHARNRLRLKVWPVLSEGFPQAEATLAQAAQWAAEAAICLEALARLDLSHAAAGEGLSHPALCELGPARARNALRAWYRSVAGRSMPATWLERLWMESQRASSRRWELPCGTVRLYRGVWTFSPHEPGADPGGNHAGSHERVAQLLEVARAGRHPVPGWGGVLYVRRPRTAEERRASVPQSLLRQVWLRPRTGGERFQLGPGRPPRSLKKQFQALGVPEWQREGPLVYAGEQLVYVPGLGVDARAAAAAGQARWVLHWERGSG